MIVPLEGESGDCLTLGFRSRRVLSRLVRFCGFGGLDGAECEQLGDFASHFRIGERSENFSASNTN
jgi:hypothetical protein